MTIQNRLQDRLIASTALDKTLVPGLSDVNARGPIVSAVGLDKVVQKVSINMAQNPADSSHARPSMLASISSFAENIRTALDAVEVGKPAAAYAALSANCVQDFIEWQGMIAAVALCNIYCGTGLRLSVEPVRLDGTDLVQQCILREMDKDTSCYRKAITQRDPNTGDPLEGYLYYICQNGEPFAVFHPEIGLCPMKNYRGDMFAGVIDWYIPQVTDCHKAWKPIINGKKSCLDDFCLSRIAWWAGQNSSGQNGSVQNGLLQYQQYVTSRMQNPAMQTNPQLAAFNSIVNSNNIDTVWQGKGTTFGTALMFYQDGAGVARPMPKLFMDTLLITYVGDQERNKLIYNTRSGEKKICFAGDHPELGAVAPVAPFSQAIMDLLEVSTLEELSFTPLVEGGRLRSVTVEAKIATGTDSVFAIHKTYQADQLRYGKLPYLMLWPFTPMPIGKDIWKKYYATWQDISEALPELERADGESISMVDKLSFTFKGQGSATKVFRPPVSQPHWTVCTNDSPFRFALIDGIAGDSRAEMGLVFMPKYPMYPVNDEVSVVDREPVKLSVDFGTTSTVCALSSANLNKGEITPLSYRDYSRAVTCDDPGAKKTLDMEHWLGNTEGGSRWSWDKKIFSVAQLFDRKHEDGMGGGGPNRTIVGHAGIQDYYVDGRMFLISGGAMINYAAAMAGESDPLRKQQIMNDMKFNEKLDVMNYQAASIFMAGIYLYAVLHLLSEKLVPGIVDFIDIRASYPNAVTLGALKKSWDYAKAILDKVISQSLTQPIEQLLRSNDHFYSEAIATTAYQRNLNYAVRATRNLVSLDIGGGTTDISITSTMYPNRTEALSIRYAGREIMVSSLISYFRRFAPNANYALEDEFKEIWEHPDESIVNQFHSLRTAGGKSTAFLHSLLTNSSARMDMELLLSEGMSLKPIQVSDSMNLLRQMITLKFLMVMKVTACAVREHIDMWKDPITDKLCIVDNKLTIDLSVSGTSAQLLQYVFDCSLSDIQDLQGKNTRIDGCIGLLNTLFESELHDILGPNVHPDLKIHVDSDVKEKREVCYGMLQGNIDDFNAMKKNAGAVNPPTAQGNQNVLAQMLQTTQQQPLGMSDAQRDQKKTEMFRFLDNYPKDSLNAFLCGKDDSEDPYERVGLLHYMIQYENMMFGPAGGNAGVQRVNRGLGDDIQTISQLLSTYENTDTGRKLVSRYSNTSFRYSQMDAAESRAAYMVEKEQDAYRDVLACVYLVDELIDWEMADIQIS